MRQVDLKKISIETEDATYIIRPNGVSKEDEAALLKNADFIYSCFDYPPEALKDFEKKYPRTYEFAKTFGVPILFKKGLFLGETKKRPDEYDKEIIIVLTFCAGAGLYWMKRQIDGIINTKLTRRDFMKLPLNGFIKLVLKGGVTYVIGSYTWDRFVEYEKLTGREGVRLAWPMIFSAFTAAALEKFVKKIKTKSEMKNKRPTIYLIIDCLPSELKVPEKLKTFLEDSGERTKFLKEYKHSLEAEIEEWPNDEFFKDKTVFYVHEVLAYTQKNGNWSEETTPVNIFE